MTHRVIVMPCSAAKRSEPFYGDGSSPADRLYTGVVWDAWRRGHPHGNLAHNWHMLVLSAKYGLVDRGAKLKPYELRLGDDGADKWALSSSVGRQWQAYKASRRHPWSLGRSADPAEDIEVIAIGGADYIELLHLSNVPTTHIIDGSAGAVGGCTGGGIGCLRKRVRSFAEWLTQAENVDPSADSYVEWFVGGTIDRWRAAMGA